MHGLGTRCQKAHLPANLATLPPCHLAKFANLAPTATSPPLVGQGSLLVRAWGRPHALPYPPPGHRGRGKGRPFPRIPLHSGHGRPWVLRLRARRGSGRPLPERRDGPRRPGRDLPFLHGGRAGQRALRRRLSGARPAQGRPAGPHPPEQRRLRPLLPGRHPGGDCPGPHLPGRWPSASSRRTSTTPAATSSRRAARGPW